LSTLFSQPTSIPGQQGGAAAPAAPAPATGQPSQGAPPEPQSQQGPGGGGMMQLLILLLPLLLIFMTMRGQSKKQKQIEAGLKTGDKVVTQSGLIGKIIEMNERTARVEIAPGVNVQMLKSAIQGPDGGDPKPGDAKAKDDKDAKDAKQEKKA
jgi:preprotein translocase subunit YajC